MQSFPAKTSPCQISLRSTVRSQNFLNEIYTSKLVELGYYDFDDMIQMVVNQMSTDEDFLLGLQEQYQFLLVDEYQDTNSLQNQIMMHLVQ